LESTRPTTLRRTIIELDRAPHGFVPILASIDSPVPSSPGVHVGQIRLVRGITTPVAGVTSLAIHDGLAASIALQVADATGQSISTRPRLARTP
jgi:hypothetical protein